MHACLQTATTPAAAPNTTCRQQIIMPANLPAPPPSAAAVGWDGAWVERQPPPSGERLQQGGETGRGLVDVSRGGGESTGRQADGRGAGWRGRAAPCPGRPARCGRLPTQPPPPQQQQSSRPTALAASKHSTATTARQLPSKGCGGQDALLRLKTTRCSKESCVMYVRAAARRAWLVPATGGMPAAISATAAVSRPEYCSHASSTSVSSSCSRASSLLSSKPMCAGGAMLPPQ
jgi:hypothetical protein